MHRRKTNVLMFGHKNGIFDLSKQYEALTIPTTASYMLVPFSREHQRA